MRFLKSFSVAGLVALAGPVFADGPALGCFERSYSDAHLAKNPAQVVRRIMLRLRWQDQAYTVGDMWVETSDQGHVAASGLGGQMFSQFLLCWSEGQTDLCAVECDGGSFSVVRQDRDGLTFQTSYLLVGALYGCGGAVDLAEVPGQTVRYRLNRVSDRACVVMAAEVGD